jgi:hypothetical protein
MYRPCLCDNLVCDLTSVDELYWQIVHPSRAEENYNRL